MAMLIHINGAPGVGKLTIARVMASRLNARVLDNHAIYNVVFGLTDFKSPEFFATVRAVRTVAYDQILRLPESEKVILTDAYFEDSDWAWESWKAIEQLAEARAWPFFTLSLLCEASEHRQRIVNEERAVNGKLRDVSYVDQAAQRSLIEKDGPFSLRCDVTNFSAGEAASKLSDWIEEIVPPAL